MCWGLPAVVVGGVSGQSWSTPVYVGAGISSSSCPTATFCVAVSAATGNAYLFNGSTWSSGSTIATGLKSVSWDLLTFAWVVMRLGRGGVGCSRLG